VSWQALDDGNDLQGQTASGRVLLKELSYRRQSRLWKAAKDLGELRGCPQALFQYFAREDFRAGFRRFQNGILKILI